VGPHAKLGRFVGERRQQNAAAVAADVDRGLSVGEIADRHWEKLYVRNRGCAMRLEVLHEAGWPPFADRPYEANPVMIEFYAFESFPRRTHGSHEFRARRVDGVPVVLAPPESEIEFAVPAGARRLTGRFGFLPEALKKERTDGARFSVEIAPGPKTPDSNASSPNAAASDAPEVLFERVLDPLHREEDRGFHALSVDLPRDGRGVVLRTSNVPGSDDVDDWPFWTEIAME